MSQESLTSKENPHAKWLRLMAAEVRQENHNGWGNTAEWAADEIDRLTALLERPQEARGGIDDEIHPWCATEEEMEEARNRQPNEPCGWQPIESAPKDGTEILLTNAGVVGAFVRIASYSYTTEKWITVSGNVMRPTHWMPLPRPPSTKFGEPT